MSTTYETLRDAVYGILNGITNIGKVHKQKRWSANKDTFKAAYMATIGSTDQIRAWWISRASTPAEAMAATSKSRDYTFQLEGFMGLDDSADTEQIFQTLLDTVMDTLDAQRASLGGTATVRHQHPLSLERYDEVMIGGYLCHHAVLKLVLEVY